jgi:hypothetical protein
MARGLEPTKRIPSWLSMYAPWFTSAEASALVAEVTDIDGDTNQFFVPLPSADNLGWALKITLAQREAWGLTTIGAVGDTKTARTKRRRKKAKERSAKNRLADGATPRAESKTQTKPWDACGMSKATWYRKGQPAPPVPATADLDVRQIRSQQILLQVRTKLSQVADRRRQEAAERSLAKGLGTVELRATG